MTGTIDFHAASVPPLLAFHPAGLTAGRVLFGFTDPCSADGAFDRLGPRAETVIFLPMQGM